jgi:hypothetical protein
MPDRNRSAELDAIEERHLHRRGNLLELDVAGALDELLQALEGMQRVTIAVPAKDVQDFLAER